MASVYLISKWTKLKNFFLINLIILIAYISITILGKDVFWDSEPYSLGIFFRIVGGTIAHILLAFIFAFLLKIKKYYSQ